VAPMTPPTIHDPATPTTVAIFWFRVSVLTSLLSKWRERRWSVRRV
jgi:hypothetical protein